MLNTSETFISHLIELRERLLRIVMGLVLVFLCLFPFVFVFIASTAPEGVAVMTDIGSYLDFVITLFMAFGMAFEVPVVVVMLVRFGMVNIKTLKEIRSYVVVGAFVLGAIFTPPDIISQIMLAVPLWLLYEVGILAAGLVNAKKAQTIGGG